MPPVEGEITVGAAAPGDERDARHEAPGGVLLTVAYDGSPFHGFAIQPGKRTVAGELLGALRALDPTVPCVRGASRTDAGVHARGQRVAFDPSRDLPPRGWVLGTARHLPREIAIRQAARVERGYTPRFLAIEKLYRYVILRDPVRDPHLARRAWRLDAPLDLERMREEARAALGTHDFAGLRGAADEREDTVRTLSSVEVIVPPGDPRLVTIAVRGDRFLYRMVRILVGTLVDVGRGRLPPGAVGRALASRRREDAGTTAPAAGLYLDEVVLRDPGRDPWPLDSP